MGDINHQQRQHRQQPPLRDYSVETDRLLTFTRWPATAPVSGEELARAGFYYLGVELEAVCSACGARHNNWSGGVECLTDVHAADCRFQRSPTAAHITEGRSPLEREHTSGLAGEMLLRGAPVSFQSDAAALERHRQRPLPAFIKVWPNLSTSYAYESARVKTFTDWPLTFVSGSELAAAGFVYIRESDRVQCVFCYGEVMDWEEGDVPMNEHRRHFPHCQLVRGVAPNVAIGSRPPVQTVFRPPIVRQGFDECGSNALTRPTPPSTPPSSSTNGSGGNVPVLHNVVNNHLSPLDRSSQHLSDLNVVPHSLPQYPKFATREARLKSYQNWPAGSSQNVNSLVEAGLFYVGSTDQVKCFQCGGGLQNWEVKDVPWEEHARWFPACNFVILHKGREYVEKSKQHRPPILPPANSPVMGQGEFSSDRPLARRAVAENELDVLMNEDMVQTVLELGFDRVIVREVLRRRVEQAGYQFTNADLLATAVLEHGDDIQTMPKPDETAALDPVGRESELPLQTTVNMEGVQTSLELAKETTSTSKTSEQELKLCKVCMDREMNVVFLPCGHFMACTDCASAMSDCPLCRVAIKGTVRTYWP